MKKSAKKAKPAKVAKPKAEVATVTVKIEKQAKPELPKFEMGALEKIIIGGDLKGLSEEQRIQYYFTLCEKLGLEAGLKPFEYIEFWEEKKIKGKSEWVSKLVLYATKNCAHQLCSTRKISVQVLSYEERDGLMIVKARASSPDGRFTDAMGALDLGNLSGKFRANAMMKCDTKASRRAILAHTGLSVLDESEVEELRTARPTAGADAVAGLVNRHAPAALTDESGTQPPVAQTIIGPKKEPAKSSERHPNAPPDDAEAARDVTPPRKVTGVPDGFEASDGMKKELARNGTTQAAADDEPKKSEPPKATGEKKNSAGDLYPTPPDDVIAMLRDGRYMAWLKWIETDGFWSNVKSGGADAMKTDFKKAIGLCANYGGVHWKRCIAAFDKSDSPIEAQGE